jgi:hypothetical protein
MEKHPPFSVESTSELNLFHTCREINPKLYRILKRVLEFLSWKELREIFLLCKDIYNKIHCDEFYIQVSKEKLRYAVPGKLTTESLLIEFNKLTGLTAMSNFAMFKALRNTYNLIQNPDGREEFKHWEVSEGNGRFVSIDKEKYCYKDKKQAFCTSFRWSFLRQRFSIGRSTAGGSLLVVGMLAARRPDCGAEAALTVRINGEKHRVTRDLLDVIAPKFEILFVRETLKREDNNIVVTFKGKDRRFKSGNYGARIGFCFAYVIDISE